MMRKTIYYLLVSAVLLSSCINTNKKNSPVYTGNPIFPGWYADPEVAVFDHTYWIYPTYSDHFGQPDTTREFTAQQMKARRNATYKPFLIQTFFDAFSSKDLVNWTKHPHVLEINNVSWAAYSMWAPSIVKANGRYYLFFSANDIKHNDQLGGIGVATATRPEGPFRDALGKPLINKIHNGAQPIDQFVFKDDDSRYYMYYGGWRHCNVVKLNNDLLSLGEFDDGDIFKEITPDKYVEGPFVLKREGKYYLMWSEGSWTGPDYCVAYAIGDTPLGPFKRKGKILEQDSTIATGAGHHSVFQFPGTDEYYIVYHRRPLGTEKPIHRQVCIDKMLFDENGDILPVKITNKGVERRALKSIKK